MDEMGMTDMQYKDHLRAVRADFERVKELCERPDGAAAAEEIGKIIERLNKAIED